jgi:hypothetical protein
MASSTAGKIEVGSRVVVGAAGAAKKGSVAFIGETQVRDVIRYYAGH